MLTVERKHWKKYNVLASNAILYILTLKGIVNSTMITFFELTDQMMRSGHWWVDAISVGKVSCQCASVRKLSLLNK